jgi:hypothetical protein
MMMMKNIEVIESHYKAGIPYDIISAIKPSVV